MLRGCVPQSRRVPSQCAEAATRPSRRKRRQAVPAERRVSCRGCGVSASAVVHDGGVSASAVVHDGGVSASAAVHDGGVSASAVVHDGVVVPLLLLKVSPLLTIFSV